MHLDEKNAKFTDRELNMNTRSSISPANLYISSAISLI